MYNINIRYTNGYCMFYLTTEISNIDFSSDIHIFDDMFTIASGNTQIHIGNEGNHGYHLLFKNDQQVISDFHGVKVEDFFMDVKHHTLSASFLIDPMGPVLELATSNPNLSIVMNPEENYIDYCQNCDKLDHVETVSDPAPIADSQGHQDEAVAQEKEENLGEAI